MLKIKKRQLLIVSAAIVGLIIASVVLSVTKTQPPPAQKQIPVPRVYSVIPNLEVVNVSLVNIATPAVGVAIEVRNKSNKTVMAVDLVSGEGAVTKNGLTDEEHPVVVIEPFGTTTLEMGFGEMTPGAPLVISAVTYGDGTEEGDANSLKLMHKVRAHDRAEKEKRRALLP